MLLSRFKILTEEEHSLSYLTVNGQFIHLRGVYTIKPNKEYMLDICKDNCVYGIINEVEEQDDTIKLITFQKRKRGRPRKFPHVI